MIDLEEFWNDLEGRESEEIRPVPGLGLGASVMAKRWALLGLTFHLNLRIKELEKRPVGRPAKDPLDSKDAYRAFLLWRMKKRLAFEGHMTNSDLISVIRQVENHLSIPSNERAFPSGNLESSVSRGKKILKISDDWESELCEKLDDD